jgi:predicted Rdx family selenoprotein
VAAELAEGHVKETNIQLTPVGGGRFEIYVNGEKVYDRLDPGGKDFYPSLRTIRQAKKLLTEALEEAAPAEPAHA